MGNQRILLGVNIDHSATVRQARYREKSDICDKIIEPDPVSVALAAEKAGADAITLHLREDRRHIQDDDVYRMRKAIQTRMNLEMAATDEMCAIALEVKPEVILLVPESREEVTTEGGLDVIQHGDRVQAIIDQVKAQGIQTSLFIDPDFQQIEAAQRLGAEYIEIHTGSYANAYYSEKRQAELDKLIAGANKAHEIGLMVNAGHGINYINISEVREIPWLHELNIGHTIISRAILTGIEEAVSTMKQLMNPLH